MQQIPYQYGYGYGSAGQGLQLSVPLLTSLTPTKAVDPTPTPPAAASIRMVEDHDGVLRRVVSGEIRFEGSRRVENLLARTGDAGDCSDWGTTNATILDNLDGTSNITIPLAGGSIASTATSIIVEGGKYFFAIDIKLISTSSGVTVRLLLGESSGTTMAQMDIEVDSTARRYFLAGTASSFTGAGAQITIQNQGETDLVFQVGRAQWEETSGALAQEVGDYTDPETDFNVGNSVLGVQNFALTNGNTGADTSRTTLQSGDDGGEVTEATGTAISDSILKGYFAEPTSRNDAASPFDFSLWTALNSPTIVANADTAPDGRITASTIEDDSASALESISTAVLITDLESVVASIYFKGDSVGATTRFVGIDIELTGGTAIVIRIGLDTSNGNIGVNSITGSPTSFAGFVETIILPNGDTWYRAWIQVANDATSNIEARMRVYPALGNTAGLSTATVAATGTTTIWGAQFQTAINVSSLIPFVGTRPTDIGLSYPIANVPLTVGFFQCEYTIPAASDKLFLVENNIIHLGGNTGRILSFPSTSMACFGQAGSGGVTISSVPTFAGGDTVTIRERWNTDGDSVDEHNISLDNGTVVVDDDTPVANFTTFAEATALQIFNTATENTDGSVGTGQAIKNIRFYNEDLGDSRLNP